MVVNNMASLIDKLPELRGSIRENYDLSKTTWFKTGGLAEVFFKPKDIADLALFLKNCPKDIPITVVGVASNLLIRDGGIKGVVIRLGREFANIEMDGELVKAGASALDMNVANFAADNGRDGLSFFSGIPGSIGGALRMNAGAYLSEMVDVLHDATIITRDGEVKNLKASDMNMTYRHNDIAEDVIFIEARLKSIAGDKEQIKKDILEVKEKRENSQPVKEKTGGSTFANPNRDNPEITKSSWQLIDEAGCRGLMIGGAEMSKKHCNFMINTGNATSHDLESLGEEVRYRVFEKFGIMLRWEIKRIGEFANAKVIMAEDRLKKVI